LWIIKTLIKKINKFSRIFTFVGVLFLFFNCFGKRSKIVVPNDIHMVSAGQLSINQWILTSRINYLDLERLMKIEKKRYLFTNLQIHQILTDNIMAMEDALNDVDQLQRDLDSIIIKLKESDGDSLLSLMENEISYGMEIGSIFEKIKDHQIEFEEGKKGIRKGLKMDRRKIIFIRDETLLWKKDFQHLRYKRASLQKAIQEYNINLGESIIDRNHINEKILSKSDKLERYRTRLDEIETFIVESEDIAYKEAGSWVCIRPLLTLESGNLKKAVPMNFEKKYQKGILDYKRILRVMSIELESI